MTTITMMIETDVETYQHNFHLGTDVKVAKDIAESYFKNLKPRFGKVIKSIALERDFKVFARYNGQWDAK